MNTITSLLESFEKLAYKFLLAVIFIPKTIVQIIVNPGWVPDYVKGELKQEKSPFDEYLSPVILLLAVALIPALVINFLSLGTNVQAEPVQGSAASHPVKFVAEAKAKSGSPDIFYQYSWEVHKAVFDENGVMDLLVHKETYNEWTDKTVIQEGEAPAKIIDGLWNTSLEYPAENYSTTRITFYYDFGKNTDTQEADYIVDFTLVSFDPERIRDAQGETFVDSTDAADFDPDGANAPFVLERQSDYRYVVVPASSDPNQQISIQAPDNKEVPSGNSESGTMINSIITWFRKDEDSPSSANVSDLLKKDTTIFLALALLFPPMIFALSVKLFSGDEISENSLRENFYMQCYYFAPLSLAIWATYYSIYFSTPDVFFYRGDVITFEGVILPSLLAFLWFISVETHAIARERKIAGWKAFLIVSICIIILVVAGRQLYLFSQPYSDVKDNWRRWLILIYPLATTILAISFLALWWKRRKAEGGKITRSDFATGFVNFFVVAGAVVLLAIANSPAGEPLLAEPVLATAEDVTTELPVTEAPQAATATGAPTQLPTETPAPEAQPFHTEEFDQSLDSWHSFMTSGLDSQVKMNLEGGRLAFQLSPRENKIPQYYLIDSEFAYEDVQLEATVTNNGNNANAALLVCRYSDLGWYEFDVSSAQQYAIYAVDTSGAVKQGYNLLASGSAAKIHSGPVTNIYTAVCKGNELTLLVNGEPVKAVTDAVYNFVRGNIGIGVASPQTLPVDLQFDSLTISQP